jgi:hypothetical protein
MDLEAMRRANDAELLRRNHVADQQDVLHVCANCRRTIHPHRPSHMPDKSACWVHDDTGIHECGPDFGDEMAEPVIAG